GHAMQQAKEAKCLVALNICDTLVVQLHAEKLMELCTTYVDILFANEMEASACTGREPKEAAAHLASKTNAIVVITQGDQGCYVAHKEKLFHSPANSVDVVDTTGAGDLFAAGFLFAFLRGDPLEECARTGNLLGGKVVSCVGTDLSSEEWLTIEREIGL
ncbi:MAG: adenosine kinase, partial [Verrucomicrobia bacterium]|nr:adenosine kinase [Verrucomicrobiota bacterium]